MEALSFSLSVDSAVSDTDRRAADDPEQNEEDSRDPALSRAEKGEWENDSN